MNWPMKPASALLVMAAVFAAGSAQAQIVLQNFSSTVDPNTFFYGTWEANGDAVFGSTNPNIQFVQGAGVFDFNGTMPLVPTNAASSKVEFFNATPGSIGSNTLLAVSAQTLGSNTASSFAVTLIDTNGVTAFSTFATSAFATGSYSMVTGALTILPGFNPGSIDSIRISGNQPGGTAQFNVSFDNISAVTAVPEPGTSAVLTGLVALLFIAWRRRAVRT